MLDVRSHERVRRPNHSGGSLMAPKSGGEKVEISWLLESQCLGEAHRRGGNERRACSVRAAARWSALRKGEVVLLA